MSSCHECSIRDDCIREKIDKISKLKLKLPLFPEIGKYDDFL